MNEFNMCAEFHRVMATRSIMGWHDMEKIPEKPGLYCAYENGESCTGHAPDERRIVYVGISGVLKKRIKRHFTGDLSNLWSRVCEALYWRGDVNEFIKFPNPSDVKEISELLTSEFKNVLPAPLVGTVSEYIRNYFSFRYICIEKSEERSELEEKIIASIAACTLVSHPSWLGNWSSITRVRSLGLWNKDHTTSDERLRQENIDRLRVLIAQPC